MPARRRRVRERVLQVLYACEMSRDNDNKVVAELLEDLRPDEIAFNFARSLILRVNEQGKELDSLIRDQVEHWEFSRLAVVDKIILRIAICEFVFFEDIPPMVSIYVAIEIARVVSPMKSLVTGILLPVFTLYPAPVSSSVITIVGSSVMNPRRIRLLARATISRS